MCDVITFDIETAKVSACDNNSSGTDGIPPVLQDEDPILVLDGLQHVGTGLVVLSADEFPGLMP